MCSFKHTRKLPLNVMQHPILIIPCFAFLGCLLFGLCQAFVQTPSIMNNDRNMKIESISSHRRCVLSLPFLLYSSAFCPHPSQALDIDAFIQNELDSEVCNNRVDKKCISKVKMSDDEALCKFGQPGKSRGDACVRIGVSTSSKTIGGVDAYGNIDRGTFERCTRSWSVVNGKYEKEDICK